jgi:hypothetical protein
MTESCALNKTYALVVGIEKYAAGPDWNLNGPASDACRFTDWLLARGIPAENIALFLSPLEDNAVLAARTNPAPQPGHQAPLNKAITETLREKQGDLLFIFWGGHGIMDQEMSRRLFYADAVTENKRNLDLNSLLTALRSSNFSGLPRQICLVDACANSLEEQRWRTNLPVDLIPHGPPRSHHDQFVFLASRRGEVAQNLSAEKTGVFSQELLQELHAVPAGQWPPDMPSVVRRVQARMETISRAGGQPQTPVFLWSRDWQGNENSLGMVAGTKSDPSLPLSEALGVPRRQAIARKLAACPHFLTENSRAEVLAMLRFNIRAAVPYSSVLLAHTYNMVDTSLHYPGGLHELIAAANFFDGGTETMEAVNELLQQFVPELKLSELF